MNIIWKGKRKGICKSGDLLLTRRSERRYAEHGGNQNNKVVISLKGQNIQTGF